MSYARCTTHAQVGASTSLQALVVSGAVLGAVFGAAIAGLLSDAYGRRTCLVVADVLFALGAAVMALAPVGHPTSFKCSLYRCNVCIYHCRFIGGAFDSLNSW